MSAAAVQRLLVVGDELPVASAVVRAAGFELVRRDPQVVLCHGGDGTLLRADREWRQAPKLPVRLASRGRLCPDHRLPARLAALSAGTLVREELPRLELRLGRRRWLALNDVVLRNESPATAVRLRVTGAGLDTGEVCGDGVVFATPFGSSGYYRSIARSVVTAGFGLAFNNSTEERAPLLSPRASPFEIEVLRGPAVLVVDNDLRGLPMRDGHRFAVTLASETAVVLGLDALRCQECRRLDGSRFNPH
jgi:NAD kinase